MISQVDGSDLRPSLAELIKGEVIDNEIDWLTLKYKVTTYYIFCQFFFLYPKLWSIMIIICGRNDDNFSLQIWTEWYFGLQVKQREEKEEVVETRKGKVLDTNIIISWSSWAWHRWSSLVGLRAWCFDASSTSGAPCSFSGDIVLVLIIIVIMMIIIIIAIMIITIKIKMVTHSYV